MDEKKSISSIARFIQSLEKLGPGEKAVLRRNAGSLISESNQAMRIFYKALPFDIPKFQEDVYFLVATFFPMAEGGGDGDLGASLVKAKWRGKNEKGIDRRFQNLLDADKAQLPFRLRQVIHLLKTNQVRVNWNQMLGDLLHWDHPDRYIQKKWARSYYSIQNKKE